MSWLSQAWLRRGCWAVLTWPLSVVFGALVALRGRLYAAGWLSRWQAPVPVVVVGNVVAGGVGKTPVVMALVAHLQRQGWQPGVVSRGYGRQTQDCRAVLPESTADEVGDEPLLIARRTQAPVFVARQRADAVRALLARHPHTNLIVCDDGLQHHALARDLEICVFDERGVGNGWLQPAGPLREPWPRLSPHSKRAPVQPTLVLHTGQPAFAGFKAQRALASHARRADGSCVALADLVSQPVIAVAALGQPTRFFDMLRGAGFTLVQAHALPDHDDFRSFFNSYLSNKHLRYCLFCTEKDAVKLWPLYPQALAVPLALALEPAFLAAVDQALAPMI
jgi:tetraacyldisaccharide 4'-kinase